MCLLLLFYRITDFGQSRKGLDETKTMTMTCGVGSPYYMAPEMLRGDNKYTRAVDLSSSPWEIFKKRSFSLTFSFEILSSAIFFKRL